MAVPKVRKSRSRTRNRRSVYLRYNIPAISICDHCGQPKTPHAVCPHCGYYKGKQIINVEE